MMWGGCTLTYNGHLGCCRVRSWSTAECDRAGRWRCVAAVGQVTVRLHISTHAGPGLFASDLLTSAEMDNAFSALMLVGWQKGHPACKKSWVVGYWCGYLSGARCRLAYGPADATATHWLVLPFWYRLTRVVPDKGPLNGSLSLLISKGFLESLEGHLVIQEKLMPYGITTFF